MARKKTPQELAETIKDAARRRAYAATRRCLLAQGGTITAERLWDTEQRQAGRLEKAVDELVAIAMKTSNA